MRPCCHFQVVEAVNAKLEQAREPASAIYCAGCNARFDRVSDSTSCPRCGAAVQSISQLSLDETLLIRRGFGDLSDAPQSCDTELDQLIGKDLHVYRCQSLLGSGGMGRVYLAHHRDLGRKCALKILSPRLSAKDVDYVARFQQEGRAAAALIHPNIVTTHAIGEESSYHFLEMEFLAGRSLQQLVDDEGRLTPVRATALASQIAEGLSAAHRENIIHRDLKPDNILLSSRGVAKIADFGLAKRILASDGVIAGRMVGTPHYMAPELFRGHPATHSSDIYALGVCYFLLLTGRLPYVAGSLDKLRQAVSTNPPPHVRQIYPDISLEMAECLSLLMAKTPGNRPRDAVEGAQLLHAVLGQVRDIESMLAEAFSDHANVAWTRTGKRYELVLTLPDGRRQTVFIEPSDHSATDRLLLIYSLCCDAQPEYYEHVLRLNSEVSHGGLAIRDIDGEAKFVMVDTYPRATVDIEEIRRSVLEIAFWADGVEKLLTGQDRH